jgi:predicted RNA-binding Zn ribbon-like protein
VAAIDVSVWLRSFSSARNRLIAYHAVITRPIDLPEDLALPLPSGAPWWYWLGGRPALDLANTLRERWRRQVETLVTPGDLGLWLARAGLFEPVVMPDVALLVDARALREAIDACATAAIVGAPMPAGAVATIDGWLDEAVARPWLALGAGGAAVLGERPVADAARHALAVVALDAARMLGRPQERARVRVCAAETCSARFYDRSPAGRRCWCSMSGCGNEAKARRHRARRKASER